MESAADLFSDRSDDAKDFNRAKDHAENRNGHESIQDEEPGNHSGVPPRKEITLTKTVCILDFSPIGARAMTVLRITFLYLATQRATGNSVLPPVIRSHSQLYPVQ